MAASLRSTRCRPRSCCDLLAERPELELIRETSHETLASRPLPDVVIIDGDHNYYTLSEELRIIDERTAGAPAADDVPRRLVAPRSTRHLLRARPHPGGASPADRLPRRRSTPRSPASPRYGLEYEWAAAREGGPRNGVLTALEDFVDGRDDLRLAVVPAFFGFGVLWQRDAPWADEVAAIIEPWDRNPVLARLEAERIFDLCTRIGKERQLGAGAGPDRPPGEAAAGAARLQCLRPRRPALAAAWRRPGGPPGASGSARSSPRARLSDEPAAAEDGKAQAEPLPRRRRRRSGRGGEAVR